MPAFLRARATEAASAPATSIGHKGEVAGAKVVAGTILDLLESPGLVARVKECFEEENKDVKCEPLLPPDTLLYGRMGNMMIPYEYTGWLDETMSWKKTCYLHTGLSMRGTWITVKGPDAVNLLSENSVGDFSTLKTGHGRHIVSCNKLGHIMGHGIILRLGEDEFCGFGCEQMLMYLGITKGYNIEPVMPKFNDYVFQIGGPNSLQVIENACQEDFHDLKFRGVGRVPALPHLPT